VHGHHQARYHLLVFSLLYIRHAEPLPVGSPGFDYAFWASIPMPALYVLQYAGRWQIISGPGA
jgi:hypothetical protein